MCLRKYVDLKHSILNLIQIEDRGAKEAELESKKVFIKEKVIPAVILRKLAL